MSNYKKFLKLSKKKFRQSSDSFLIEGWRGVEEILNSDFEVLSILFLNEIEISSSRKLLLQNLKKKSKNYFEFSSKEFQKLSSTVNSQGIIVEVNKKKYNFDEIIKSKNKISTIIALDEISDPGNLGTIIRICDWFNVDALLVSKSSCELFNSKVIRSSVGSILHFPIFESVDLISEIKKMKNYQIVGADLNSSNSIEKFKFQEKLCIIIGSEAHGITNQLKKIIPENFTIPRFGKAESLNAAVALSVILTKRFL